MRYQDYGAGVGLRSSYYDEFWDSAPAGVRWVEAVSENYMPWPSRGNSRPLSTLLRIRANIPVALHGVSLSIGSADALSLDYLKSLRDLIDRVEPILLSDHLCWTGVEGVNAHDLLPLPYTRETLRHVSKKILRVQDFLKRPLLIENVSSYVQFSASSMTEWDFLNALCKHTGCGLLLDINNVYVSSQNHGFNPLEFLDAIPAERVGQIHLAGHSRMKAKNPTASLRDAVVLIDTHNAPVCDEVWALYRWWVRHKGLHSAMIERDGNFPEWNELFAEVHQLEKIRNEERNTKRNTEKIPALSL